MNYHNLKTWPEYLTAIHEGNKTFEVRRHDRDFQIGDLLVLRGYDPKTQEYTGNLARRRVTYILTGGQFGIAEGYCVMGLSLPTLTDFVEQRGKINDLVRQGEPPSQG